MTTPPLVSIICVSYEESKDRIDYTLKSIINQNFIDKEIIIIDGGSSSNSLKYFEKYLPYIKHFISKKDNGIFDAMNIGLSYASGLWINFMNFGDSFYEKNTLNTIFSKNLRNYDLIYGNVLNLKYGHRKYANKITKRILYQHNICHQSLFARKKIFDLIGNFETKYKTGGDPDWILRACSAGFKFMYLDMTICNYADDGLSSEWSLDKRLRILKKHYTVAERIIYWLYYLPLRAYKRILARNFSLPKSWIS